MLWQDLREYLDRLGALGDLKRVSRASWEEDIGAITELMTERQGPALLFDDIPGYPKGFRGKTRTNWQSTWHSALTPLRLRSRSPGTDTSRANR